MKITRRLCYSLGFSASSSNSLDQPVVITVSFFLPIMKNAVFVQPA